MYLAYGDFFAKNFCAQSLYFFVDLFYFFC